MEFARQKTGEVYSFGGKNSAGVVKLRKSGSAKIIQEKAGSRRIGGAEPRAYI